MSPPSPALRPRLLDGDWERAEPADRWPRFRATLHRCLRRLAAHPLHGPRLAEIRPESIQQPADLAALPFTTKAMLHPEGGALHHLSVPRQQLARIHASSGTTGDRTLVAYTTADLHLWTALVARGLAAVGVCEDTVCYSMLGNGLFTGGLGFHQAATALGAATVPAGPGGSAAHLALVRRLRPDVLFATPSYALHVAQNHEAHATPAACTPLPPKLRIPLGIFGAEPWTEAVRQALETHWAMHARDTYGLGEVIGPGVAFECGRGEGMHINADAIWPEIIDPISGTVLPDGEPGELVLTVPGKEALPLLRYRTGDRTRLLRAPCSCGRTWVRMARVASRIDDMRVVRGVNIYPSQVAAVVGDRAFVLELRAAGGLSQLVVHVEQRRGEHQLPGDLHHRLASALGLRVRLQPHPPGGLGHSGGKAQRWLERRAPETPARRQTPDPTG